MKILIAEDEKALQTSIKTFLEKDAHVCETASDYEEALYRISLYDYDMVLLDINLLNGSGLDVLKQLKNPGAKQVSSSFLPTIPWTISWKVWTWEPMIISPNLFIWPNSIPGSKRCFAGANSAVTRNCNFRKSPSKPGLKQCS